MAGLAAKFDPKASGIFKGLGKAKASQSANYVRPGNLILRLDKFKVDKARKGEILAIEMTVLKVLGGGVPGKDPHTVYEAVTHLLPNFGNGQDMFLPNLKGFLENILDVPENELQDDEGLEQMCLQISNEDPANGPVQPMRGILIHLQATDITTKAGRPFTRIDYQREVPAAEALTTLDPAVVAWAYPDHGLQRRAVYETTMAEALAAGKTPAEASALATAAKDAFVPTA